MSAIRNKDTATVSGRTAKREALKRLAPSSKGDITADPDHDQEPPCWNRDLINQAAVV